MAQSAQNIRKPVFAGQFYSAGPLILKREIKNFLSRARSSQDLKVCGLIVPHAGHMYSGAVAAEAYKLVEGRKFDSVVIIAFLHRAFLQGILVDDVVAYETPLGRVPVDRELAREIQMFHPLFRNVMSGRLEEHSLEVQIPFLQETVPELKIIPIYIGTQDITNITVLANALAKTLEGRNVLVVATTDLSHFHPYETAFGKDKALIAMFEKGNAEAIYDAYAKEEAEACGMGPVLTSILLARKMKWFGPRLVRYANSGDVTGDRSSVVGYAAMAYRKMVC
ncbi:MAG: AmmeMemoRadiSam system protein B [Candidatus Omnitrophota bacterium]